MNKVQNKIIFSTIIFASMLIAAVSANAAPVKFKQVVQVVNVKPGKAATANFSKLHVSNDPVAPINIGDGDGDGDKEKKTTKSPQQDDRVIITTTEEIVEDTENCQCEGVEAIEIARSGFPKWPLFGLGAVPLGFIKTGDDPEGETTPTPTTPTPTPTTPTATPTPEPMTLLLFGTGLAGIGFAARKRFGKKSQETE